MKIQKICGNCIKGTPMPVNSDVFCREKGIVSPDYSCSGHRFLPEPKTFREQNYKCTDCINFIYSIRNAEKGKIGICQLFSVRSFNGDQRQACSKFAKRKELGVS